MLNNIFVSIIVPIYNVEQYLPKCIESIIAQTYKNFELILVDDGSSDSCSYLCDLYAEKDKRIKVIHKPNGGLVSARKKGLQVSSGKYILNVDGDDYIESDMLECMLRDALKDDADIVITGYNCINELECEKKRNLIDSGVYTGETLNELIESMVYSGYFYEPGVIPAVWNKLFKRELYFDLQNDVPEEIRMGEDFAVSYPCILNSKRIVINNELVSYNYRILNNSMSRTFDVSYFKRVLSLFNYIDNVFVNKSVQYQLKYYKLFILFYGCNKYLFTGSKNFIKKNRNLKKILKSFNFDFLQGIVINDSFSREVRLFINALNNKSYIGYCFKHYLFIVCTKFKK